jgi:hypothetical protein
MIRPKVRDPRFVTIRRGGTLTDADHRLLALWAAACPERVLDPSESARPQDPRLRLGAWRGRDDAGPRGRRPCDGRRPGPARHGCATTSAGRCSAAESGRPGTSPSTRSPPPGGGEGVPASLPRDEWTGPNPPPRPAGAPTPADGGVGGEARRCDQAGTGLRQRGLHLGTVAEAAGTGHMRAGVPPVPLPRHRPYQQREGQQPWRASRDWPCPRSTRTASYGSSGHAAAISSPVLAGRPGGFLGGGDGSVGQVHQRGGTRAE